MRTPYIGSIVHYVRYDKTHCAAIVTNVNIVSVDLSAFTASSMEHVLKVSWVKYSDNHEICTWHWPEEEANPVTTLTDSELIRSIAEYKRDNFLLRRNVAGLLQDNKMLLDKLDKVKEAVMPVEAKK